MSPFSDWHEPTRRGTIQKWVFRLLLFFAVVSVVILVVQDHRRSNQLEKQNAFLVKVNSDLRELSRVQQSAAVTIAKNVCIDTRTLLSDLVLRTLNATYDEYQKDPDEVLRRYRIQLSESPSFNGDEQLINEAVERTRDILKRTSPRGCNAP